MKNLGKLVGLAMIVALMVSVLVMPMMISDAMAAACNNQGASCPGTNAPAEIPCAAGNNPLLDYYCQPLCTQVGNAACPGGAAPTNACNAPTASNFNFYCAAAGGGGGAANTPEMSDYLAMAFIVAAGAIMYRRHRRSGMTSA